MGFANKSRKTSGSIILGEGCRTGEERDNELNRSISGCFRCCRGRPDGRPDVILAHLRQIAFTLP